MWQRVRRKWSDPRVEPGYNESGIWKTTDGGQTWTDASSGLPVAAVSAAASGSTSSRSNPNVLYAFVDSYEAGRPPRDGRARRVRPPDRREPDQGRGDLPHRRQGRDVAQGERETNDFMPQHSGTYGWVFGQIRVDPTDENTIYTLGLEPERLA